MLSRVADSLYWIALSHQRDQWHVAALKLGEALQRTAIVTTDEVLTEVLAFCSSDEGLRSDAAKIVRGILTGQAVRVMPQSHEGFLRGLVLYEARPDKGYSLTDCISMETMRQEGLTSVLTNDRHFEQEGFNALFRQM